MALTTLNLSAMQRKDPCAEFFEACMGYDGGMRAIDESGSNGTGDRCVAAWLACEQRK